VEALKSLPSQIWGVLRPRLARAWRHARRVTEQALHPSRRRAARAKLARSQRWEGALVLCYGNVCRSPYAASLLIQAFAERGLRIPVRQGGFIGPGRRSPAIARRVARALGVNLRPHRSRLVTPEDTHGQTLVVVMETSQAERVMRELGVPGNRIVVLGDLDPGPIDSRSITDPWGLEREVFEEVYVRISRCVTALVECLQTHGTAPPARMDSPGEAHDEDAGSGGPSRPGNYAFEVPTMHG
jgi:protein-tyrosine-phosphatase